MIAWHRKCVTPGYQHIKENDVIVVTSLLNPRAKYNIHKDIYLQNTFRVSRIIEQTRTELGVYV